MHRIQAPRADLATLVVLGWFAALAGLFAIAFYSLMRPTVLPNPGVAAYKPAVPVFELNTVSHVADMERVAIAATNHENEQQGISAPHLALAAAPAPAAQAPVKPADLKPPTKPKRKAVARAPREERYASDPWRPWESRSRSYDDYRRTRAADYYSDRSRGSWFR